MTEWLSVRDKIQAKDIVKPNPVLLQPAACPWEDAAVMLDGRWPVISEQRSGGRCSGHSAFQGVWAAAERGDLLVYDR